MTKAVIQRAQHETRKMWRTPNANFCRERNGPTELYYRKMIVERYVRPSWTLCGLSVCRSINGYSLSNLLQQQTYKMNTPATPSSTEKRTETEKNKQKKASRENWRARHTVNLSSGPSAGDKPTCRAVYSRLDPYRVTRLWLGYTCRQLEVALCDDD